MNMMLKMVLGTCLLGFVNLHGMTDAKKPEAKKPDRLSGSNRRSSDKFVKAMGSLKVSCNDVIRLHSEAIARYQSVLEGDDGKLATFAQLDEAERREVLGVKETLFKELDALGTQEEFVQVVKALHESEFNAGRIERLVVQDQKKLLVVDPVTNKMILSSIARVTLWGDEHFIIEQFRAMAKTIEKENSVSIVVDQEDAKESYQSLIRQRLVYCNFIDSSDKKVKHTKFSDDVEELLGMVKSAAEQSADPAHVVGQLCKCAGDLVKKYLVPVL